MNNNDIDKINMNIIPKLIPPANSGSGNANNSMINDIINSNIYKNAVSHFFGKRLSIVEVTQEMKKIISQFKSITNDAYNTLLEHFLADINVKSSVGNEIGNENKVGGSEETPYNQNINTIYRDFGDESDKFSPYDSGINGTYNVQKEIKRFELARELRQNSQKMVLSDKGFAPLDDNDLLSTHKLDYSFTNINTIGTLPNNRKDVRYYQETYRSINISSRQRQLYQDRIVVPSDRDFFPNKEIWDRFFNCTCEKFENIELCCDTFNNLIRFEQDYPYFFIKNCKLWIRVAVDPSTSQYTIPLSPACRNIRYVRLRGVEIPGTSSDLFSGDQVTLTNPLTNQSTLFNANSLNQINSTNNLLMVDVINPETGESFPHTESLPFSLILIPIGNYTIDSLLTLIIKLLNKSILPVEAVEDVNASVEGPFSYFYDAHTGEINIKCEFLFHLRFWFSSTHPQFNLYDMLGYQFPFPVDENNEPAYVHCFSNIVEIPSPLTNLGLVNCVPYKKPKLNVHTYIYLSIRHLSVIQDQVVILYDLFAKIPIGGNGNLVPSTKVFLEPYNKLEKIEVRWLDAFGNLVDFSGLENSFLIEVVEYQDKLKDSEYSSVRGLANFEPEVPGVVYKVNSS